LVRQQAYFPIFKGGLGLVFVEVIAPTSHLGSKGLIVPIIASRFLLDGRQFLLGAIRAKNLGPFPF
jgi:hypothetical protein